MPVFARFLPPLAALTLGACVSVPTGPSVLVLPGTGKSFEEFRGDDLMCRQYAQDQIGGQSPNAVAANSGALSAATGAVLGAAAGAAVNGGRGAGVGAGSGLALGGLVGTGTAQSAAGSLQQRYDFGYQQCMYAKGNRVPVYGNFASDSRYWSSPPNVAPPTRR